MKKDRKPNEMLKKLQAQPSAKNISSRIVTASGPLPPKEIKPSIIPSDIISKEYAKEPLDIAKKATEIDKNLDDIAGALSSKKAVGTITKEADDAYKAAKGFKKLHSILGLLPMAAAAGLSLYSPGSKAAEIARRVSEEGDPTSVLFPPEAGAGEDIEIKKMYEEAIRDRNKPQKELQQIVKPMIKEVGGEPDIRPEKAMKMLGEQKSEDKDIEQELTRENYEKMLKRRLGY